MIRYISLFFSINYLIINTALAEVYGGLGFDYGFPHSGNERSHGSILVGNRTNALGFFYGGELDFGVSLGSTFDYTTARGRVLFGRPFETLSPILSVGSTIYIDNGTTYVGPNISGGFEANLTRASIFRVEAIRDFNPDHTTPVTAIRLAIISLY